MIICRSCRSAWPDSALYCGKCRRSFGGRRCPKNHLSPKDAAYCLTCGSRELSTAADSLSLGWAARILAWILALALLRLAWPIIAFTAMPILGACDWLSGFLLGTKASELLGTVVGFMTQLAVLTGVFALLIPGFRRRLPAFLGTGWRSTRSLCGLVRPALGFAGSAVRSLIQGTHRGQKTKDGHGSDSRNV